MVKTTHARDRALWDRMVNEQWNGAQPVLSPEQSLAAAKKLYRHAMGNKGREFNWELTSGNRYTWPRGSTFRVNPDKRQQAARGLRAIIHDVSHYCHHKLHPNDSPHSARQARLEAKLTKFAIERGWHEGKIAPAKVRKKPSAMDRSKAAAAAAKERGQAPGGGK